MRFFWEPKETAKWVTVIFTPLLICCLAAVLCWHHNLRFFFYLPTHFLALFPLSVWCHLSGNIEKYSHVCSIKQIMNIFCICIWIDIKTGKPENTLCCIKHQNNFYHIVKPRELSLPKKNGRHLSRTLANYLLFFVIIDRFLFMQSYSPIFSPSSQLLHQ